MKKIIISLILMVLLSGTAFGLTNSDDLDCGNNICEYYEEAFNEGDSDKITVNGEKLDIELISFDEPMSTTWDINSHEGSLSEIHNSYLRTLFETRVRLLGFSNQIFLKEEQYCPIDCINDKDTDNKIVEFEITPGWNLLNVNTVLILPQCKFASDNELCEDDIVHVFVWIPELSEYVDFKDMNSIPDDKMEFVDEFLEENYNLDYFISGWVYFKDAIENKKSPQTIFPSQRTLLDRYELSEGWNFVSVLPSMVYDEDKNYDPLTLDEIRGDCEIDNLYFFIDDEWEDGLVNDENLFGRSYVGKGMLIESQNDCNLGEGSINAPPPPPMPQ